MFVVSIRRSHVQAAILLATLSGSLYALSFCDLNWLLLAAIALLACYCCVCEFYRLLGYSEDSLRAICFHQQTGRLIYSDRQVSVGKPRLRYFSEFLIVLEFAIHQGNARDEKYNRRKQGGIQRVLGGSSHRVALWPDSLSPQDLRELRRYLIFMDQSS